MITAVIKSWLTLLNILVLKHCKHLKGRKKFGTKLWPHHNKTNKCAPFLLSHTRMEVSCLGWSLTGKSCSTKPVKNTCNADIHHHVKATIDLFLYIEFLKGPWFVITWLHRKKVYPVYVKTFFVFSKTNTQINKWY